MTDPVDTDALRARADENGEWAQTAAGLPNREQDVLELLLNADVLRTAADEVDRLRTLIAEMPHEYPQCTVGYIDGVDESGCICIKREADAL